MKKSLLYLCCIVSISLASCSRWIAPPYTSVSEISNVKKGMTREQVNQTLGIEAYDIYTMQEDGTTILMYNYRLKERSMKLSGDLGMATKTQASQKAGTEIYGSPSLLFVLFQDDKVSSLITSRGREDAEHLLLTNNNIQLISKQQLVTLQNSDDPALLILDEKGSVNHLNLPQKTGTSNKSVIIPIKDKGNTKSPESQIQKNNTLKKIALIAVPIIILIGLL